MAEQFQLLGFIETAADCWQPVYNVTVARDTDLDKIVFGSTTNECFQQIQVKYPVDDPRLTRVCLQTIYNRPIEADSHPDDSIRIIQPQYDGNDFDEAVAIGMLVGHVKVSSYLLTGRKDDWVKAGFKIPGYGLKKRCHYGHIYEAIYDPKAAQKLLKRRKTVATNSLIAVNLIGAVYRVMYDTFSSCNIPMSWLYASKYDQCVPALLKSVALFNWIFGKNAHRKLEKFQELKQQWKVKEVQTVKHLRKDDGKSVYFTQTIFPAYCKFCNWMSEESKMRNVPLHKGKWSPLRKIPDFESFSDVKREKIMAKKKATKKAGKPTKKTTKKVVKKAAGKKGVKASTAKKPAVKKSSAKEATMQAQSATVGGSFIDIDNAVTDNVIRVAYTINRGTCTTPEEDAVVSAADIEPLNTETAGLANAESGN